MRGGLSGEGTAVESEPEDGADGEQNGAEPADRRVGVLAHGAGLAGLVANVGGQERDGDEQDGDLDH